jgi:hypothetical protein
LSDPAIPDLIDLVIDMHGWIRRVPLGAGAVVLGRSSGCDVVLGDPQLSRRHCQLRPDGGDFVVEDLGSERGTFVDGVPVREPVPLRPGNTLQMGAIRARLERRPADSILSGDPLRDDRNVRVLLSTVAELYQTRHVGELLRTIVDRSIRIAGGTRGALLLAAADGRLEVAVSRSAEGRDLPAEQVLTRALPIRALQSGRPVVLNDVQHPEQKGLATASVSQLDLRRVLCVPLPSGDGYSGVLYVDAQRPEGVFGRAELAVFEALAVQAAMAIERARVGEQHQRKEAEARRRLETENAALGPDKTPAGGRQPHHAKPARLVTVPRGAIRRHLSPARPAQERGLARYVHRLSARNGGPSSLSTAVPSPRG